MNKIQTENKTEIKTKSKAMIFLMHNAHKGSKTFVKTVCTTVQSNNSFLFKWVVSCWKIDQTSCISAFDWHFFVIYTAPMQGNTAMQYVLLNALLVRNVTGTQAGATRWAQLQADRNTHINERELRRLRLAVKGDSSFPSPCVWLGNGWFLAGESLVAVMTAARGVCPVRVSGDTRHSSDRKRKAILACNSPVQSRGHMWQQLLRKWPNSWTPASRPISLRLTLEKFSEKEGIWKMG